MKTGNTSEEAKALWANKAYREKMVLASRRRWARKEERERLSCLAKEQWKDEKFRETVSSSAKKLWADPEFRAKKTELARADMAARMKDPAYSRKASLASARAQAKRRPNKPEAELHSALSLAGVAFRSQFLVRLKKTHTVADAFIPKANLLVYSDGVYWHSKPEAKKRDRRLRSECEKLGYVVFVIRQDLELGPQVERLLALVS